MTSAAPAEARHALLNVDAVSVQFGGLRALDEVSLSLGEVDIAAIIGPNGAGKTTLFNVINGLQRPRAGHVRLDGIDVTRRGADDRMRRGLSRTFQRVRLAGNLDVLDNVLLGLHGRGWRGGRDARVRARQALEFVDLASREHNFPHALTLGERKRAEVARAIVNQPRLLLLDETFAGLSGAESANLAEIVIRLSRQGVRVLLIEHDMTLVMRLAQWIYVLDFGRKLAEGRPQEVRANPAVVEAYLGSHA